MPDENTQVAVANASADPAAASAPGGLEQAAATQEGAASANGAQPEPMQDYKALYQDADAKAKAEASAREAAEKRARDAEQTARTAQGDQSATRRELNRIREDFRRGRELDAAEQEGPERVKEVQQRHTDADLQMHGVAIVAEFNKLGLSTTEWETNQAFTRARKAWRSDPELAVELVQDAVERLKAEKDSKLAAEKTIAETPIAATPSANTPAKPAAAKPIPNMDTGRGVGAGAESLQALVNRLAKGAILTDDEHAKARDAMENKGIYPD